MTEDYLHYIWKHRLFETNELKTVNGEPITIIHSGNHNKNSGPDFLEGKIKIGEQLWAGHVELHTYSSDWQKHNHQSDKAYNNVILHVVYADEGTALREDGTQIPTLELKGLFDEMGYWRYEQFVSAKRFLACGEQVKSVDDIHIATMLDRVLVERLEEKSAFVQQVFESTNNDWSETFYRMLMYSFGLKINAEAMLHLAECLPLSVLRKHTGNHFQVEALLFGCAGFLEGDDEFQRTLKKEFAFLQAKYNLQLLAKEEFKFSRLRPMGFATVRLAQLAGILSKTPDIFRVAIGVEKPAQILELLATETSAYWQNHFTFGKESTEQEKPVSATLANQVMINAVVPTLFLYATLKNETETRFRVIDWLRELKAEQNQVVKNYAQTGFNANSAFDSQALLQLYKNYCQQRKCLSCAVGVKLLKQ
jgi:hypothetical protein